MKWLRASIKNELKGRSGVLGILRRRHFKRKSTPQPGTPLTGAGRHSQQKDGIKPRSRSLGSISVINPEYNTAAIAKALQINTNRMHLRMAISLEDLCNLDRRNNNPRHNFDSIVLLHAFNALKYKQEWPQRHHSNSSFTNEFLLSNLFQCQSLPFLSEHRLSGKGVKEHSVLAKCWSHSCPITQHNISPKALVIEKLFKGNQEKQINDSLEKQGNNSNYQKKNGDQEDNNLNYNPKDKLEDKTIGAFDSIIRNLNKDSIDVHLDRIDELNLLLDQHLQRIYNDGSSQNESKATKEAASPLSLPDNQTNCKEKSHKKVTPMANDGMSAILLETESKNKRPLSFSQRSFSALLNNIRDFSRNRSLTPKLQQNNAEDVNKAKLLKNHSEQNQLFEQEKNTQVLQNNENQLKNNKKEAILPPPSKARTSPFRFKLMSSFQSRKDKLCKSCTPKRQIYPNRETRDFSKDFCTKSVKNGDFRGRQMLFSEISNVCEMTEDADDEEFDILNFDLLKEHCYCVPSLAASVSRLQIRWNYITNKLQLIYLFRFSKYNLKTKFYFLKLTSTKNFI